MGVTPESNASPKRMVGKAPRHRLLISFLLFLLSITIPEWKLSAKFSPAFVDDNSMPAFSVMRFYSKL